MARATDYCLLMIILVISSSAQSSAACFCIARHGIRLPPNRLYRQSARRQLRMYDDDEGGKSKETNDTDRSTKREGLTWEELSADPELRKIEFDSSMNRKNSLLLPQRISQAITTLAWLFVAGGIILNQLGLAYIKAPSGGIGIGSLDERDFQREVMREGRRINAENEKGTVSVVPKDYATHHIFSWMRQGDEATT